jgi:hypothetical protein
MLSLPYAAIGTMTQHQREALDSLVKAEVFFPIALLVAGVLLLLFGFKAYRAVVVFNCIALGFWIGGLLGEKAQIATVAAVIGAVLLGAISWPLMKYAVAVCGGLVGAIVGMVAWSWFDLPQDMAWAGGLSGLILVGMLSFLLFKFSIIFFSCVQGAAMLVLGVSALIIKYTPYNKDVVSNLEGKPILIPLIVFSLAFLGIIYQQQRHGLLGGEGGPKTGGASGGGDAKPSKK